MPLGPRHVGQRVVVRYRLPDPEPGGPSMTDVLGELEAYDADGLVVRTEADERVRVPAAAVVAGEAGAAPRVAPCCGCAATPSSGSAPTAGRPARSSRWASGSCGRRRGSPAGPTRCCRSAIPDCPLPEALAAVEEFYARYGLPALAQAVIGTPVERQLLDAGWDVARHKRGRAGAGGLGRAGAAHQPYRRGRASTCCRHPTTRGCRSTAAPPACPPTWWPACSPGPRTVALAARRRRRYGPVAIGRGVVTGDWLGLSAVEVVPRAPARGAGPAGGRRAARRGAPSRGRGRRTCRRCRATTGALALYAPYGFVTHHRYRYLAPAPGRAGPGARSLTGRRTSEP